jgi:uncharacterized damage-inducible protein DinB
MPRGKPLDVAGELIEAFDRSARLTEYLVAALPAYVWQADPLQGEGRSIAAIVAHMQSLRRGFAKMGGYEPVAQTLSGRAPTQEEAVEALRQSREALVELFGGALERGEARVKGLPRRTIDMLTYLMQHDAHHRGQIAMMAREFGHRLTEDDVMRMWGWKKLP